MNQLCQEKNGFLYPMSQLVTIDDKPSDHHVLLLEGQHVDLIPARGSSKTLRFSGPPEREF